LIQGEMTGRNILTDQSLRYGVDLRQPFRMLLIDSSGSAVPAISALERRISRVLETEEHHALTGQFAGQVLILVQAFNDISHLAQHIYEQTRDDYLIRIGISAKTSGARLVKDAYMQCREVLHITRRLAYPQPIVWFDELGYLHTLYKAGPEALMNNLHTAALELLMDEQGADLFHTLETYLDAGGSAVRTAQQLNIHRSTLNYRMQRISEITGADLSDPVARVNLQMALKLHRLFGDR
jgi:sugar diacid utilization regulator